MKEKLQRLKNNISRQITEKSYINYILIVIVSMVICLPLLKKNLNIYIDDGIQHLCRLIGTYQTLASKQFLPMIMSNFCNNFGYSWNIFYSPITAYAPLLFKIFKFSFTNCLKMFIFVITCLSGVTMYRLVLKVTKNKNISTLAAILYVLAPYRLTDMYIRVALAELASFVFLPMVFEGLYTIINEEKKTYLLAWGIIGLILTHTVITLYVAILCFIYVLVFIKKLKDKKILANLVINLLFGIVITSFYWVGLLQHYFGASYEVFVPGRMEREEVLKYFKVQFHELFITTKEQIMIYSIGLVPIVGLILTPIAFKKISKDCKKTYVTFLIFGLVLTFMTLTFFPFEKLPDMLTMLQFTFRLFEFTSFFFAIIAAINYGILIKKFRIRDIVVLSIITILLIVPYKSKLDFDTKYNENELIEPRKITHNTGRIHAGMASMEYLPSKAFNNLDYLVDREDSPIILNDTLAEITGYQKNGSNMEFKIVINEDTEIEFPYIYYLGYRIYVNDKEIPYEESENGFIQAKITEDMCNNNEALIEVKYTGTNAMLVSFVISIIGALGLVILGKL